jgi:hypothetical protein
MANLCSGLGHGQEADEDHEHRPEYGERGIAFGVAEHALLLFGEWDCAGSLAGRRQDREDRPDGGY